MAESLRQRMIKNSKTLETISKEITIGDNLYPRKFSIVPKKEESDDLPSEINTTYLFHRSSRGKVISSKYYR